MTLCRCSLRGVSSRVSPWRGETQGSRRLVSQLKSHLEGVMERSLGEYVGWGDEEGGGNEGREVVCQGNTEL